MFRVNLYLPVYRNLNKDSFHPRGIRLRYFDKFLISI